jgi:hypothetical protein
LGTILQHRWFLHWNLRQHPHQKEASGGSPQGLFIFVLQLHFDY